MRSDDGYWIATAEPTAYPALEGERSADVAVVGGGVAGCTVAMLLQEAGLDVVVLEAGRIGHGITGRSTVKVTASHGLRVGEIEARHGRDLAGAYARANAAGLAEVARFVEERSIDCSFERRDHLIWAETEEERERVRAEAELEASLGLPASFVEETAELPFPTLGALRMADQAQFHPVRYVQGLAGAVAAGGGGVFERTPVAHIANGSPARVSTPAGEVVATHVVIATGYPISEGRFFFARVAQEREYALAVRLREGTPPSEMYLWAGSPTRSMRRHGDVLVVVGEGHRVGEEAETAVHHVRLEAWARERLGDLEVLHRWSNQDVFPLDGLPMAGTSSALGDHIWVVTGFSSWGMTNAAAAARIVRDEILGVSPPEWRGAYAPGRAVAFRAPKEALRHNIAAATHFVRDRMAGAPGTPEALGPGQAGVFKVDGDQVAAYRDDEGLLHTVSAVCTHLRCIVAWNEAERSWDCPCHGSRFAPDGAVLSPPATRPLPPAGG